MRDLLASHRRSNITFACLIASALACGCGDNWFGHETGDATYQLENLTSEAVEARWVTSARLGGDEESLGPIEPLETVELRSDSMLGRDLLPADTFESIRLYAADVEVFVQSPVTTDGWTLVRSDADEAVGHTDITLTVGDADLVDQPQ